VTKLITILLSLMTLSSPGPVVRAVASSVVTTKTSDTLVAVACDSTCLPITYSWTKVSGPGLQTITNPSTSQATVSGLQLGFYIFKVVVANSAGVQASDTVGFTVGIAVHDTVYVTTTVTIHDTIPRVCPSCPPPVICPVCPVIPQRVATGTVIRGNVVTTYYNNGDSTNGNTKSPIVIQ